MCVCVCVCRGTHTHTQTKKKKKKTEKKPKCVKFVEFCVEFSNQNQYSWCLRTSFLIYVYVGRNEGNGKNNLQKERERKNI